MKTNLCTKSELATLLRLTPRGVECLMLRKKIPFFRISRKCVRFDAEMPADRMQVVVRRAKWPVPAIGVSSVAA